MPELSPLPQMGSGNTVGTPTASTGGGGGLKTTLHIPDMAADVAVTLGTPVKAGRRDSAGPGHDGYPSAAPVRLSGPCRSSDLWPGGVRTPDLARLARSASCRRTGHITGITSVTYIHSRNSLLDFAQT